MKKNLIVIFVSILVAVSVVYAAVSPLRQSIIKIANKYKGVPYVYGSESPNAFDCSGFTRYVYREAYGIELPRSAAGQFSGGVPIEIKDAKAGDIFCYDTVGGRPSHVSIYTGNDSVIHAVSAGSKTGVIETPNSSKYWSARLIAARRYITENDEKPKTVEKPQLETPKEPKVDSKTSTNKTQATEKPTENKTVYSMTNSPAIENAGKVTLASKEVYEASAKSIDPEDNIQDIALVIPEKKSAQTDKIPVAIGTGIKFVATNGSGKTGTFEVAFFYYKPNSNKINKLHEEKVTLEVGEAVDIPTYTFKTAGKYKLVVKLKGIQLLERTFMVRD